MLTGEHGFEPPDRVFLASGRRPPSREPEEHELGSTRHSWQHEAAVQCDWAFLERHITTASERALLRSQSGHGLVRCTLDSECCRLHLRLPPSSRFCRCGHRAACLRTGELGKRRCAVERATARVCREAGERVATNVRDLDIAAPNPRDGRRLEIVVDGLPLFGEHSLQCTPLWCLLSTVTALTLQVLLIQMARRRDERSYPELVHSRAWAKLTVLVGEVAGRWSDETQFPSAARTCPIEERGKVDAS